MKPVELTVVDTNTAAWELFPVAYIGANLEHVPLMSDPETGMMILKMVYRAGFTNPWHSHPCAHGVYVLDGTLSTHQGRYPAGARVVPWKEGSRSTARAQEEDCMSCSSPNKPFDIHFVGDEGRPARAEVLARPGTEREPRRSGARREIMPNGLVFASRNVPAGWSGWRTPGTCCRRARRSMGQAGDRSGMVYREGVVLGPAALGTVMPTRPDLSSRSAPR
jgi:hypothetical protein